MRDRELVSQKLVLSVARRKKRITQLDSFKDIQLKAQGSKLKNDENWTELNEQFREKREALEKLATKIL